MVMPPKRGVLRRLKLEELITKMQQIEEQVALTLHEYPHGHTLERQRLVLAITKQVRAHLEDQLKGEVRVAVLDDDSDGRRLRVVSDKGASQ